MTCNWELYELRVVIYRPSPGGKDPGDIWYEFFNVSVDLRSFGMSDFQGSNNQCNFRDVFGQLAALRTIPFSFPKERIASNRLNFSNLQAAERNKAGYNIAKLYVHRRDQDDRTSLLHGVGVILERVYVDFTAPTPLFYAILSGSSASVVN